MAANPFHQPVSKDMNGAKRSVEAFGDAARQADMALVTACQEGDDTAFEALMRRYKDRVYAVLYRFLGNREDALDVAQEVFLRAYRGMADFRGEARVYTWLYRIAVNLARNRVRDRGRKGRDQATSLEGLEEAAPGAAQAAAADCDTPREHAQRGELQAALEACLEQVPDVYRLAFVLRIFDERSYEEIADALECPEGTVKSRLNQARRLLRACLEQNGVL